MEARDSGLLSLAGTSVEAAASRSTETQIIRKVTAAGTKRREEARCMPL